MFLRIVLAGLTCIATAAQQSATPPASTSAAQGANHQGVTDQGVTYQGVTYQINGTLVDSNTRQPISGARVAIAPVTKRDALTTVITGEDGVFSFFFLTPGKYTLTAQARGYIAQSFNQHDQFSSSIVVGPDLDSTNLVFRLPPESAIYGTITDEAGEPVREASVMLYRTGVAFGSEGPRLRSQMMTNDEGSYHFSHLTPGQYLLAVTAKVWYAQRPAAQESVSGLDSGRVYSSRGTFSYNGPAPASSGGGEEQGRSPLDVAYPVTFYPGVTDPASAEPIRLAPGDKFSADLSLQPEPALHLHFNFEASDSNQSAYVQLQTKLFDAAPIPIPSDIRTGPGGSVDVLGVPPGHYTARIVSYDPKQAQAASSMEVEALASGEVPRAETKGFAVVAAKLQLDPGVELPHQAFLQLFNMKSREGFREQIPESGEVEYKQSVPPGSYEVSVNNSGPAFIRSISATGAKVSGRTVQITGSGPVKLTIALGHGQGRITGIALRDGKPFAGAMIVAVPADPAHNQVLFRRDQSDSDGSFTLASVVPGKYTVLALENGWDLEWTKPQVLKPFMAQGQAIEVQQNGKYEVKVTVQ